MKPISLARVPERPHWAVPAYLALQFWTLELLVNGLTVFGLAWLRIAFVLASFAIPVVSFYSARAAISGMKPGSRPATRAAWTFVAIYAFTFPVVLLGEYARHVLRAGPPLNATNLTSAAWLKLWLFSPPIFWMDFGFLGPILSPLAVWFGSGARLGPPPEEGS